MQKNLQLSKCEIKKYIMKNIQTELYMIILVVLRIVSDTNIINIIFSNFNFFNYFSIRKYSFLCNHIEILFFYNLFCMFC